MQTVEEIRNRLVFYRRTFAILRRLSDGSEAAHEASMAHLGAIRALECLLDEAEIKR